MGGEAVEEEGSPFPSWCSDPRAMPGRRAWLQSLAPLGVVTVSIFILLVCSAALFPLGRCHAGTSASELCLQNSQAESPGTEERCNEKQFHVRLSLLLRGSKCFKRTP